MLLVRYILEMCFKKFALLLFALQQWRFCAGNLNATFGNDVTIPCASSSNYPIWKGPEIFNGNNIEYNSAGSSAFNSQFIPKQKRVRLSWANDLKSLVIKNVTVSDEGAYYCSNQTILIVRVKPSEPIIRQVSNASSGDFAEINCTSSGSRPAASITWFYRNRIHLGEQTIIFDEATNTSTVISLLKMQVNAEDNGQSVQCTVSHPLQESSISVNLDVLFPVKDSSTSITGNTTKVATGDRSLTLTCTTGSSNPGSDIKWFNGSVEMKNTQGYTAWTGENNGEVRSQKLVLYPTRGMDGDKFTCSVSNIENIRSPVNDSVKLDLLYSPLVMIDGPQTHNINEGDSVKLTCKVESKPAANIKWYHNNTLLSERTSMDNIHNLTIEPVKRNHYGIYYCKASNNIGEGNDDQVFIGVKFKPLTVEISGNKNIIANGRTELLLVCTSGSSNPVSNITWKINNVIASATKLLANLNGDFGGKKRRAELSLTPKRNNDGDTISCEAQNILGTSEISKEILDLKYGPIIEPTPNVTAVEGSRTELRCSASSKPASTFQWYKEGQSTILYEGTGVKGNNQLPFVIPKVKRGDAALYRCNANNNVETPDNNNVLLTVHYPPNVSVVGSNTSVTSPSATLTCKATGVPDNYRYRKWIQTWPGYNIPVSETAGSETLKLTDLTYEHSGVYTCSASNGIRIFGTNQEFIEGSTQILIKSFPVITNINEKVTARVSEVVNVEIEYYSNTGGSVVSLKKNTEGLRQRAPNYSVSKSNTNIDLPVFTHTIKTTGTKATVSLSIESKEDIGHYAIIVSNEVDATVRSFEVIPEGPPSGPFNVRVDNIQQTTARVSWQQGYHGGFDQTFLIQLSTDKIHWENVETVFGGKDESTEQKYKTIRDLKHSTTYYVRIYSFNRDGTSPYSQYQNFTTFLITDSGVSGPPLGGIVGGTVTALVVIALIVVIIVLARRKKLTKEKIRSRFQAVFSIISKRNQQRQRKDEYSDDNAYEVSDTSTVNKTNAKQNQINIYEKLQRSPSNENTKPYEVIKVEKETAFDSKTVYENLPKKKCATEAFKSEIADKLRKGKPQIYENLKPGMKGAKKK